MARVNPQNYSVSPDELISQMLARGHRITRRQLQRWQAEDLIPRPKQTMKKGEAGSKTLYRTDTPQSVLAICLLRTKIRSTSRLRWALWRLGHPIPSVYWKPKLVSAAKRFDKFYRTFMQKEFADSEPEFVEGAENAISVLSRKPISNPVLGPLKRNLGSSDFAMFMQLMLETPIRSSTFSQTADPQGNTNKSKNRHDDPLDLNQSLLERAFKKPKSSTDSIMTADNLQEEFHRFKETRDVEQSVSNLVKRKTSPELSRSSYLLSIVCFEAEQLATQANDTRWKSVSSLKPDTGKLSVSEEAMLIVGWLLMIESEDFQKHLGKFFDPK